LLIWRDGIRQYGMCVHTCPPGYFGVRGLEVNRCTTPTGTRTCGCKWGVETRVREVPEAAREEGTACPALLETRRCRMKKHCPGEKTEPKNKGKKRQKKPKTERHTGT
ncbi:R-spondin-4, partial [Geospiza fortis]|uniref:R-spondin-4 n=1 Tax=Geospiza fortis TaxID=48883 RepID=A0A6I9Z8Y1_GEOFO